MSKFFNPEIIIPGIKILVNFERLNAWLMREVILKKTLSQDPSFLIMPSGSFHIVSISSRICSVIWGVDALP